VRHKPRQKGLYINTDNGGYAHSNSVLLPEVTYEHSTTVTAYKAWNVVNNHLIYRSGIYSPYQYKDFDEMMTAASFVGADVITDFYFIGSDLYQGNYGQAAISAGATVVPFVNAPILKAAILPILFRLKEMATRTNKWADIIEISPSTVSEAMGYFDEMTEGMTKITKETPKGRIIIANNPTGGTVSIRHFASDGSPNTHTTIDFSTELSNQLGVDKIKFDH
jgi:hypothetical protein